MIINPHLEPKTIEDYDILFTNGILLPITIDKALGDTVDIESDPLVAKFKLAGRPSQGDPDLKLSSEEITIFISHVISITKRIREVMPITPEQQEAFRKTLHKVPSTIQ